MTNSDLIRRLILEGYLEEDNFREAFLAVDRIHYIPEEFQAGAYRDIALPLFEGQTISQPSTVAFMLELLEPQKGNRILEIGAGSGWLTALLSHLVGQSGFVFAYEINRKVGRFGLKNLESRTLRNFSYIIGDVKKHWHEKAPYDRIISGAAFSAIEEDFLKLLKKKGTAVIPTSQNDIRKIYKNEEDEISTQIFPGFVFVPFK